MVQISDFLGCVSHGHCWKYSVLFFPHYFRDILLDNSRQSLNSFFEVIIIRGLQFGLVVDPDTQILFFTTLDVIHTASKNHADNNSRPLVH